MAEQSIVVAGNRSLINKPDRRFWGTTTGIKVEGGTTIVGSIYSLSIVEVETFETFILEGLDPAKRTNLAIYHFPVAPSQYEITEPTATTIQATQNGGKFVESHGSIFKDTRISGTVGFRPNVPSSELIGGLQAATGVKLEVPGPLSDILFNDERGLKRNEATGFDDIIFLRNLFRAYCNLKTEQSGIGSKVGLLWTYAKEGESYIVEPISFNTQRDSSNPLSWRYNIQLRTLYALNQSFVAVEDPMNIFQVFNKSFEMFTRVGQAINRSLNAFADVVNYFATLPFDAVDTVFGAAADVMRGFAAVQNSFDFDRLKENRVKQWQASVRDVFGQLTADTSTIGGTGQVGRVGVARKVCRDMWRQANMCLCLDFLWEQPRQVQVEDYSSAYQDEVGDDPITTGSPLNLANITIPGSGAERQIEELDIKDAAKRLLGNSARWKELAILNDLRPPYIAAERSDGVLQPGDKIVVPKGVDDIDAENFVPRETNRDQALEDQSPIFKRYGRDLKLVGTNLGLSDVGVTASGDLNLIDGPSNVEQAMLIKFSTEQGELATHPRFGASFPIGSKFPSLARLQEFSLNTQRTIRQDPRVDEIDEIKTFINQDQVQIQAEIKLRAANVRLPISFSVRR
jgi:hypothetical protein